MLVLGCKDASFSVAHASSHLQVNHLLVTPWQISSIFCGCVLLQEDRCPFTPALWAFGINIWIFFPVCMESAATRGAVGTSSPSDLFACLATCVYRTTLRWWIPGCSQEKTNTVCLGICEEDSRAGSSVQMLYPSRTTQLHFGQGCTSGPSLDPSAPAKKAQDVLLREHLQMFFSKNRRSSPKTSAYRKTKMGIQRCLRNTQKPGSHFSFPVCRCSRRHSWAGFVQLHWVQTEGIWPISRHKG